MIPLRLPLVDAAPAPGWAKVAPESRALLTHLRIVGLACRTAARTDLFKACALLTTDTQEAQTAYAETLMRCLPQAIGKRPVVYTPGTQDLSFDEAWLLRLIEAAGREDEPSFTFLLQSRVAPHARRSITFLARFVACHLQERAVA